MKKSLLLLAVAGTMIIGMGSCNKEEMPAPAYLAITIEGRSNRPTALPIMVKWTGLTGIYVSSLFDDLPAASGAVPSRSSPPAWTR